MGDFTFSKKERLSSEKSIQELFSKGSSFYLFPFKVLYLPVTSDEISVHQVLISVSKRNFKTAVSRNLLKRKIREAYRLKKDLVSSTGPLRIALIYSHKEILATQEILDKMVHVLRRISRLCGKNSS